MNVIFLKDILDTRQEIKTYEADLARQLEKRAYLDRQIALTERIIRMIKKEEIIEIKTVSDKV